MYPNTPTETEIYIRMMEKEGVSKEKIIKDYIDAHNTKHMVEGVDYYHKRNEITKRVIYRYDENGNKFVDMEATNNKIASGWYPLLVNQKGSYLAGDEATIGGDDATAIDTVKEHLGDDWNDELLQLIISASNQGREWLHPYINEEGEFDYIRISAQEGIPIYDNSKRKEIVAFIRYYTLDDGESVKVEFWDDEQCTYYEMYEGEIVIDASVDVNPEPHFYYVNGESSEGYGWGKVPFIEFANNEGRTTDLALLKDYIDAYDILMSDTTNSLQDIQNIFYILKGYEDQNLSSFINNMRRYKAVKTDEDGDVVPVQAEIPMDSISAQLERFISDIFDFGMGVNTDVEKFGNAPSGVALKNLYSYLDMKANMLERKFKKGLRELVWFISEYENVTPGGSPFDPKGITFTFNKSMLSNEAETIDMLSKSIASEETKLENDPFVTDVQLELERKKKEMDEYMQNMPDVAGEDDEPTGD